MKQNEALKKPFAGKSDKESSRVKDRLYGISLTVDSNADDDFKSAS